MKFFRVFFGQPRSRIWFIVAVLVAAVIIVANILTDVYGGVISLALGGDKAIPVDAADAQVYYERTTASKSEANEKGFDLTRKVSEEGSILLKNDRSTLPLTDGNLKISVFGKNSVDLVYGGSGSGGGDLTFAKKTLFESLSAVGISYNPKLKEFYEDKSRSGKGRDSSPELTAGSMALEPISFGETPTESYDATLESSYGAYNDAALIVIARYGGESWDLPKVRGAARDQKHALALDKYERELIDYVSDRFDKVIVVLNTLNVIEAGELNDNEKVDGIIWIGGPGSTGIMALGDILTGKVNPSGHTVDIWARDFTKDPTWNNFSEAVNEDGNYIAKSAFYVGDSSLSSETFVRYQENIYIGYRYYETKAFEEKRADASSDWYRENVVYPFGYGLSYTRFEWEITDKSSIENAAVSADGTYKVKVRVKNVGDREGKDVVQMYAKPHYNRGGLEKSHVVLCGFAKTSLIKPGKSEIVTIEFKPYDIASYDHKGISGKKGWVIEAGNDYELIIASDSSAYSEKRFSIPFRVTSDIRYETDPVTDNPVINRYTDQTDETFDSDYLIGELMTRESFIQPSAPTDTDRNASARLVAALKDVSHNNPLAATYTEKPVHGVEATNVFMDLVRYDNAKKAWVADYDGNDEVWEAILSAITVQEMSNMINQAGFKTDRIESINKPETLESDGPVGWCNFIAMGDTWKNNVAYTSQIVVSSTWNVDLAREMGECVGEEALWGAASADGRTYSGWYSPGVNLHRSAFGGRNFEYYSEDAFLTGKIAAALIKGCRSKGVYTFVKHFVVNEQETCRSGVATYVTEQALRELYLKPFETAVKEGGTTSVMTSFNRLGTRWTGGDYRLLTEILRNEWGFRGTVICDYNTGDPFMNVKQMVYAGGDLNLATDSNSEWKVNRKSDAADITVVRMATKNVLYTVANSNAINNLHYRYEPAAWKVVFLVVEIVIGVVMVAWGVYAIITAFKISKSKGITIVVEDDGDQ